LCHALRGEWAASLGYHPAGVLLAAALIGWMVWSAAKPVAAALSPASLVVGWARRC
jgi:hypothetical protein